MGMATGISTGHAPSAPSDLGRQGLRSLRRRRQAPELVVAEADSGLWEVRSVIGQQQLGDARTQLAAIEIAVAKLRDAGGGRLAVHSRRGRIELRTVTAAGRLVPV
jgi:hypothetical protein